MRFFRKLSHEGEDYRGHWPVNDDHRTRPLLDVGWRLSREDYLQELAAAEAGEPVLSVRDEEHYRSLLAAERARRLAQTLLTDFET